MIIFDNSVLSSFTKLGLLNELKKLFHCIFLTDAIFEEYSKTFSSKLPEFFVIGRITTKYKLPFPPNSLSNADLSLIKLAVNKSLPIATDDLSLRIYAKSLKIKVTGSVGILRAMWEEGIIVDRNMYSSLVTNLQNDLFLTPELIIWLLRDIH